MRQQFLAPQFIDVKNEKKIFEKKKFLGSGSVFL